MSAAGRARALARRLARRGAADAHADPLAPWERVVAGGLFDQAYYEAQTGTRFPDEGAAVRDYLRRGGPAGRSPHPLFEPEWSRADGWRRRPDALLGYLDGDVGDPSPWFDEDAYAAAHPGAAQHAGRCLGHFLARASDTTPVPAPRHHQRLVLGDVRRLMTDLAHQERSFREVRAAQPRGRWDEARDRELVARCAGAPAVPGGADGGPAVTVVMPVRNRPVQVREAIASVQSQQHESWELVVVDDGSSDETPDVVEAYDDPRVRVLRREHRGVSAARNAGVEAARGRWLAFLDSDNTWEPLFLRVMLTHLEQEGLKAGYCVVDQGADVDPDRRYLCLDAGLDHLLVRNHVDLNGLVVATAVAREAGGFDPTMRRWVDHDFAIRLARRTHLGLVPFVGVRYDHSDDAEDRITTRESESWQWAALAKGHVDWAEVDRALPGRRHDRVSVCMTTADDWQRTLACVESVLAAADAQEPGTRGSEVEVVVQLNGARRAVAALLLARFAGEDRVRFIRVARNLHRSIGATMAFAASTGRRVAFLAPETEVGGDWLGPLLGALEDPRVLGAQPLLLDPQGTVHCAGLLFTARHPLPVPLLAGHPLEDVRRVGPPPLHAVSGAALVVRAEDVAALRGFDPRLVDGLEDADLCLRAVGGGERRFVVVPGSTVLRHPSGASSSERWGPANRQLWAERWGERPPPSEEEVLGMLAMDVHRLVATRGATSRPDDPWSLRPLLVRRPERTPSGDPVVRFALQTGFPAGGAAGQDDLAAAHGVAAALRAAGHDAVVDDARTAQRCTTYLDDVAVAVSGACGPVVATPGGMTVLWRLAGAGRSGGPDAVERAQHDVVLDAPAGADPHQVAAELVALARAGRPEAPSTRPDDRGDRPVAGR